MLDLDFELDHVGLSIWVSLSDVVPKGSRSCQTNSFAEGISFKHSRITLHTCESSFAIANVIGLVAVRAFSAVELSVFRMQRTVLNKARTPTQQSQLGR